MKTMSLAQFNEALERGPYTWPGGYPLFFTMADGEALSFKAAEAEAERIRQEIVEPTSRDWLPVAVAVNWEDADLVCAHTNTPIESAYGKEDAA